MQSRQDAAAAGQRRPCPWGNNQYPAEHFGSLQMCPTLAVITQISVVHKLSVKWERELTELHDASLDPVPRYLQQSHRSQLVPIVWQGRATRIHQTGTVERLHHGRVGVAADQNIHTPAELSLHR